MAVPILATKLYTPPPRPTTISRPRLIQRLNACLGQTDLFSRKLSLISAPAGFGKTTLVADWLNQQDGAILPLLPAKKGWLSLDEQDNDLHHFFAYLIAALQMIHPDIGTRSLPLLEAAPPPLPAMFLTTLINELAAFPEKLLLVLDDYHEIVTPAIDKALAFLLEHLPPQMHLVITTREDPQLPLPRLRVRGELTELRAADLRFTTAEAAQFFQTASGLELTADEIAALDRRTEGWIAGLQLAALSMQGRDDISGFVDAFAGDHHYIVDYLAAEVLERQPPEIGRFLLQTSILDRLHGPLCAAVTGNESSARMLAHLERNNMFVIPLDNRRQWYRYHHLFADLLQARLLQENPEAVPELHRRAGAWCAHHDLPLEAIRHALAGADFPRAADLLELNWSKMDQNRESKAWLRLARELPEPAARSRPVLALGFTWALFDNGELEAGEKWLHAAENWLRQAGPEPAKQADNGLIIKDQKEFRALHGSLATARAYYALAHNDLSAAMEHGQRAMQLLPEGDYVRRGTPASLIGLASWAAGDLEAAYHSFAAAMDNFHRGGNLLFAITGTYILAGIRLAQGRLREAIGVYQHALQLARTEGGADMRGLADLHLGLSELYREQGNEEKAEQHFRQSESLRDTAALPRYRYRHCLARAQRHESRGELDDAFTQLAEAEQLYLRGPVPDVRPIPALQARIRIKQGRLDEAEAWIEAHFPAGEDDLSYLREYEQLTLVRLRIAQYKKEGAAQRLQAALDVLERLLQEAETSGRGGSALDILLQQALALAAGGDQTAALAPLGEALARAEPEGYSRIFTDEGEPLRELLETAVTRNIHPTYANRLLSSFAQSATTAAQKTPSPAPAQRLVEPLSERELEVLHLVAEGLSNREISERLFLALSTVKGHNRNIYSKLGVQRRTEAVARGRELGIL